MKYSDKKNAALITVLSAAGIIFCVSAVSCKPKQAAPAAGEETETMFAVNTYKTSEGSLDEYLEFGGDVSSVSSVDVLPDMAGKIARILVSVGDMVQKDQIIAYVDASRPGMNYSASPVKAPISGRVTSFAPTVGTMVSQSMSIAKIADTDELQIKVNVAERFISRISDGQTAVVTFDAYPGVSFTAKVFEVSPVLDTTTRTMAIRLRVEPADPRIRVGMYARVRLVTNTRKNAIVIPEASVVTRNAKDNVFIIVPAASESEKPTVRISEITRGISVDGRTEVISGITAGDEIVVKGQGLLNDGSTVNIISVSDSL